MAASLRGFGQVTFFEAIEKQEPLFVSTVEGSSTQKVSAEIPKNLDSNLTTEEVNAVKQKLRAANQRMVAYRVPTIGSNEVEIRKLFQFAKELNVDTIVSDPPVEALPAIDKVANELNIRVALLNRGRNETPAYADPRSLLKAVEGLSKHIGAAVDTASWMREGIRPADGVKLLGDRLIAVHLLDRSSLGPRGRNVTLGSGAAGLTGLFDAIYRLGLQPSFFTVEYSGSGDPVADMSKSFDALEKALQPVAGDRVGQIAKATPIRGPERLTEKDRAGVEAAVPATAPAKPKRPRRLLVIDLQVGYGGHGSIPAANMAVELWGKKTGAYETVLSNDLDNLKYPRIKQFDAIFLNNTVGELFPDPQVRVGLMRFIREGGGLIGYHATAHASADWPEFGDMLGARRGNHRDANEKATIKIDDPASPLTAAFEGKEFEWQDEFFRYTTPPYAREKVHVLLSFDVEKTDMHQKPDCNICDRADNDIAVSWIRSYGKGRIFYATIGHLPRLFATPPLAKFFLAGIQFALGDLHADTTPGGKKSKGGASN
jgi:type 1 glutamine amidotransferase/sugar phosphate isomerase/epimerase